MSGPDEKKAPPNKTVQICMIVFLAIGIGGYQAVAPKLFPTPPGGGLNLERIVWASVN